MGTKRAEAKRLIVTYLRLNSITTKLILLCALIVIIPLLYQSLASVNIISSGMISQYSSAMRENVSNERQLLENYFGSMRDWSVSITGNMGYMNLLSSRGPQQMTQRLRMDGAIKRIYTAHSEVRSLKSFTTFDQIRTRISREYESYTYNWSTLDRFCVQHAISRQQLESADFALLPAQPQGGEAVSDAFSAAWFIRSQDGGLLQVLQAEIDSAALAGLFPDIHFLDGEALMLVDADGRVIYSQCAAQLGGEHFSGLALAATGRESDEYIFFNDTRYRLFSSEPFADGLRVIRFLPEHAFDGIAYAAQPGIIGMTLMCLVLSIAVLVGIIYRFMRPLRQLAESMRQAGGGEFGRRIKVSSTDVEIQPVIEQFNTMTTLINQLFNETYRLKLEQQRAQLRALQAQINPHFLYNTLQTIHFMALKRNAYEIGTIVDSLGDILRYCLRRGEEQVPLEAEIQNITRYLTIQKMRFLQRLTVQMRVDDRVKGAMMPKMILQPLVENCIVHGVQESAGPCVIVIDCHLERDRVVITVRDDGAGIPEERLREIRDSLNAAEGEPPEDHIGVINCHLRLKYFFLGEAEFEIDSRDGQGTSVRISYPERRCENEVPDCG